MLWPVALGAPAVSQSSRSKCLSSPSSVGQSIGTRKLLKVVGSSGGREHSGKSAETLGEHTAPRVEVRDSQGGASPFSPQLMVLFVRRDSRQVWGSHGRQTGHINLICMTPFQSHHHRQ